MSARHILLTTLLQASIRNTTLRLCLLIVSVELSADWSDWCEYVTARESLRESDMDST